MKKDEYRFMQYGLFMCWLPWRQQIILWIGMIFFFAFLGGATFLVAGLWSTASGEPNWISVLAGYAAMLTASNAIYLLRIPAQRWQPRTKNML